MSGAERDAERARILRELPAEAQNLHVTIHADDEAQAYLDRRRKERIS